MSLASLIIQLVSRSTVAPRRTLIATVALFGAALFYVVIAFSMTTNTDALIDAHVHWREVEADKGRAFPQLNNLSLVIVDASTAEGAERAAADMASAMSDDRAHFQSVRRPEADAFFKQNGLLFASTADVRTSTDALIKAQPLLGPLAADPSLRGLAQTLDTVSAGALRERTSTAQLSPVFAKIAIAIDLSLDGHPAHFSWLALVGGQSGVTKAPLRQLILYQPVLDYRSIKPSEAATRAIQKISQQLNVANTDGASVRITGGAALSDEEFSSLEENIGAVGMVMALAMVATLWFATRSARIVGAILLTIIVGLVITIAVGLVAVRSFNIISVAFIPLFVGLGVDFGIQIAVKFNAERQTGEMVAPALVRTAGGIGGSLGLAAAAIFLGFGAFLPTAYRGIAELGIIAGLGMIVALGLNVTLLPALLVLLNPAPAHQREVSTRVAALDDALIVYRKRVLWAFAAAMIGSIALLPLVQFDFNPLHLRDPHGPAMAALTDLTRDPLRTPNAIDVIAPNIRSADAIVDKLRALPEVAQVVTLMSFVPADQVQKLPIIQDADALLDLTLNPFVTASPPSDADTKVALQKAATTLDTLSATAHDPNAAALARAFGRLAQGNAVQRAQVEHLLMDPFATMLDDVRQSLKAGPVKSDTLPDDIRQDWLSANGRVRLAVFPKGDSNDNRVLRTFAAAVQRVVPDATGLAITTQAAAATIAGAFVEASVLALILVSALLYYVLRSVREVAFTLAPVVLSGFLTLGTCVVIGQPINFANIIAFPLLFGVGVAFHIYFVMAWRAGVTHLLQSSLARAVLFSAIATGTAFGALWLSHHPGTASMGKILMISLAWTLVCALIFEPALLGPIEVRQEEGGAGGVAGWGAGLGAGDGWGGVSGGGDILGASGEAGCGTAAGSASGSSRSDAAGFLSRSSATSAARFC